MKNFTISRIVKTRNLLPLLILFFSLPVFQLVGQNCSISIVITDIVCNDNGTSLDADDDTYSFNMTVVGTNASAQWEGNFGSGYLGTFAVGPTNYGEVLPFGPLAAGDFIPTNILPPTVVSGGQDMDIFVNDVANPNCSTTITVSSPGTCSQVAVPTCNITGNFIVTDGCLTDEFTVLVDANDPYNPPNNPKYSYDYDIASDNTITGINTTDPRSLNIRYGTPGIKTITATLRENANPACKQTFTTSFNVIDCNASECLVGLDVTNILCSDAGTPYDASDDTYTFNVQVFRTGGTDPSGGYELDVSNGNLGVFIIPGTYGDNHLVGPFPIGFDMDLRVTTKGTPSCSDFQTVSSPAACSIPQAECSIAIDVTNIRCRDNSTPSDASDDTFTFDLAVFRTGGTTGNGWIANYDNVNLGAFIETGEYGIRTTVGPFPIGNDININVSSDGTPSCSANAVAVSPAACSNAPACAIGGTFSVADGCLSEEFRLFVDANDPYFPPNNPRYIYEYNLNEDNTILLFSSIDPRDVKVTYATPGIKTMTATLTDRNDPTCTQTFTTTFVVTDCTVVEPEPCVVSIDISNNVCQENGMFTFDLTVLRTGGTPGDTWEGAIFVDDAGFLLTGTYNETITLGPYSVLAQSQIAPFNNFRRSIGVAVNALGITDCSDLVEVLAPENCTTAQSPPPCTIAGTFSVMDGCLGDEYRLFVDANDPYNPPNNPRYIYDYNLGADNTISGASSVDPRSVNVTYSTPGTKTITATVTDRNDPNCVITLTTSFEVMDCGLEGPETCLVAIDISNNVCQDNGMFTFDLTVFRTAVAPGSTWEGTLGIDDTGTRITGTYNERMTMGPFTALEQRMTDPLNLFRRRVLISVNALGIPACDDFIEVLAPESCATPPPLGGIDYCANLRVVGGPGQIVINGVDAPNHRIQYRLYPSTPYTDICVNNCFESQLIYGLGANTYYIRVEQSSADGGDFCEQEYTVEVSPALTASNSRASAFMEFNAYQEARQVDLEWLTNTTYKSDYFLIEKSINGLTFETLATVDNEPVGLDVGYFKSIDSQPTMGDNYYRLKQIYQDGSFAYSAVRHIRFGVDVHAIDLFPNPANQELYINLTEFVGKEASLIIANQYGVVVAEHQVAAISAEPLRIDLAEYTNGLYFIRTKISKTKIITKKFLVSKLY